MAADTFSGHLVHTSKKEQLLSDCVRGIIQDESNWRIHKPDQWWAKHGYDDVDDPTNSDIYEALDDTQTPLITLTNGYLRVTLSRMDEISVGEEAISYPAGIAAQCDRAPLRQGNTSVDSYLDVVEVLTNVSEPDYVFGMVGWPGSKDEIPSVEDLRAGRIPEVFWLNVFSSPTIERLGRERLLSAPAWEIREIGTDHVMVVTSDSPMDPSEEWRYGPEDVMTHLSEAETETVSRYDDTQTPTQWYEAEQAKWLIPPEDEDEE